MSTPEYYKMYYGQHEAEKEKYREEHKKENAKYEKDRYLNDIYYKKRNTSKT